MALATAKQLSEQVITGVEHCEIPESSEEWEIVGGHDVYWPKQHVESTKAKTTMAEASPV